MSKKSKKHTSSLDHLIMKPGRIGLTGIVMAIKEPNIILGNRQGKCCDLMYIHKFGHISLAEYKCGDGYRNKAICQLEETEDFVREYLGAERVDKYYVHNDFESEKV